MKSRRIGKTSSALASLTTSNPMRTGLQEEEIAAAVLDKLHYEQAIPPGLATRDDSYFALALAVRDRLVDR